MTASPTPERRSLHALVRARLWQILSVLAHHDITSMSLSCRNDRDEIRLSVGPIGQVAPAGNTLPPGYFSPIELLVVNAIGPERALTLKQIVHDSGVKLTSELPTLIRNLKARGVLVHRQGEPGVRWSDDYHRLRGGSRI
jgi:hypothetical protein